MPYKDPEKQKEYFKKWYAKNREKEIKSAVERNKRNRKKVSDFIKEHKKGKGCNCCSEKESCCLDFHHIKGDKEISIADAPYTCGWGIDRVKKILNRCE